MSDPEEEKKKRIVYPMDFYLAVMTFYKMDPRTAQGNAIRYARVHGIEYISDTVITYFTNLKKGTPPRDDLTEARYYELICTKYPQFRKMLFDENLGDMKVYVITSKGGLAYYDNEEEAIRSINSSPEAIESIRIVIQGRELQLVTETITQVCRLDKAEIDETY